MCLTHQDSDVHQSSPRHQRAVDHQRPGVPARTRAWPARGPAVPVHAMPVAAGRVRRAVRDGVNAVAADYLRVPARPEHLRPTAVNTAVYADVWRATAIHLVHTTL